MSVVELDRGWTRDDALDAMRCLLESAARLKRMPPGVLDSVMLSTQATGPLGLHELADAVAFDLRIAQAVAENHRAGRSRVEGGA